MRQITFEKTLKKLGGILEKIGLADYAIIGGIAVEFYTRKPRTTKDIDAIVNKKMSAAGWENVKALLDAKASQIGETPEVLEFTVDGITVHLFPVMSRIDVELMQKKTLFSIKLGNFKINIASPEQVLLWKIDAMTSPMRKKHDKQRDMADITEILDSYPEVNVALLDGILKREGYYENRFKSLTGDDKGMWNTVKAMIDAKSQTRYFDQDINGRGI